MYEIIRRLFGLKPGVDYKELVKAGAVILDVRSAGEFRAGHIRGSINISVDQLGAHVSRLKKGVPIITCCASGMRSASARRMLQSRGFEPVYNGGSWVGLRSKLLE